MSSIDPPLLRILMVCMGNICRSPTAEAVVRERLRRAGLDRRVEVDSAGTHGWHAGEPPDARSMAHARKRGYDLSVLRARRFEEADFERFDRIYVMDRDNLRELERICPRDSVVRPTLLMSVLGGRGAEVPDPYSGGAADFERVLDLIEQAAQAIVTELLSEPAGPGRS